VSDRAEEERNAQILNEKGLPLPPQMPILNLRFNIGTVDWYAKTPKGWYWLRTQDVRTYEWKVCPYGPPGIDWRDL